MISAILLSIAVQTAQTPARDTSARQGDAAPAVSGRISGRVVAGDSGRALKRARVFINAAELPGGRGVLTDDAGAFDFTELPPGRYTVTVSKSGFVSLSYGQRRPLQAGTPLQLNDGQQLRNVDFQLPRGSVIGGRVVDEDGEPMPGVAVRAMRYQYLQGERRLTAAGSGQTDDKGQFRIWGLMPGDYYVNATARAGFPDGRGAQGFGGRGGRAASPAGPVAAAGGGAAADSENINYAPTYYPGVPSVNDARAIALGLSQELLDVNFSMQLVPMSRVAGRMTTSDGSAAGRGQVNLALDSAGRGNQIGATLGGRVLGDGSFAINNVPPGRYVLRAFGGDPAALQFSTLPVTVNGADITDLSVVLSPGATISGIVEFQAASTPAGPPDLTQFRIVAPAMDPAGTIGPQSTARIDKDGRFTLTGLAAGGHLLRAGGNTRGWTLKSVTAGGRNITDAPIDVRGGESVANVTMVFTDKVSELTGLVTGAQGAPAPEFTILAFSTDAAFWRPQSRQIAATRPDQTGQYRIRTLPPGEYYVVPVDPAEQGEWFEPAYLEAHRSGAARVTLSEGDKKTLDVRVRQ